MFQVKLLLVDWCTVAATPPQEDSGPSHWSPHAWIARTVKNMETWMDEASLSGHLTCSLGCP
jgi:hypothetical protein